LGAFRHLSDHELNELSDDELFDYMVRARAAGQRDAAKLALQMLVFGHLDTIEKRVRLKVPAEAVDEVVGKAFLSAVVGRLRGESYGEFRSWLNTIVDRRIADYHRRKNRPDEVPLASEHEGDEAIWGEVPTVEGEADAVEAAAVIEQVLDARRDVHRRVVEVYAFDQATADETADQVNAEMAPNPVMTKDNVHQIYSRFRKDLIDALEGEGNTS
jgi:RNA polymerase sigma factor (sigma-70 family)